MKKVIVAVSGGPDSMALLHMMKNKKYQIIAAHVDYGVRKTSNEDRKVIEKMIEDTDIKLHVVEAPKHTEGNFQAFAREFRYDFMVELAQEYNANEIFVGHHEDDHIETYLMQKLRDSIPTYYGLNEISKYQGVSIRRPLLRYSKRQLIAYCHNYNIDYVIDESNLENDYTRNLIRNTTVSIYTEEKRQEVLDEINRENKKLHKHRKDIASKAKKFLKTKRVSKLLVHNDQDIIDILRMYAHEHHFYDISDKELENILRFVKSDNNGEYKISDDYVLTKAYDQLEIRETVVETFEYKFEHVEAFECDYFKISDRGASTEAVTLFESDFPITIRNYREGDEIKMRFGTKKVRRFFIDRKIPEYLRKTWPIVVNASDEIILVPGLGCNLTHYSNIPSMFVVK